MKKQLNDEVEKTRPDANPDPITGTPGAHPVGTGIGAAAAGAAGLAIGSVVPGIGSAIGGAVGAAIGAFAGGLAGKGLAEVIDPTAEGVYWRGEYRHRKYFDSALDYDRDFAPAYRYGWESFSQFGHREPAEIEDQLQADWKEHRGESRLEWDRAQHAVHDAWARIKSIHAHDRNDPNGLGSHPSNIL